MSRVSTADALRFVAEHESIDLGSGLVYERIVRRGEDPNLDGGIAGRYELKLGSVRKSYVRASYCGGETGSGG